MLLAASPAAAQGPAAAPSLARTKTERELAELVQSITQDPAITVDDPAIRPLVQAVMLEGLRQLQIRAYRQALANFLYAYAKLPSPRILLYVASALRDLGQLADAANTYQRYLSDPAADPATGVDRAAEVRELLAQLDEQLTILTVRVMPRGAEISIDGGSFVRVGGTLVTRVRSGLHLIRIRKDRLTSELSVRGQEGEAKEVALTLAVAEPAAAALPRDAPGASNSSLAPERVEGWLITGTQYSADSATGRERKVYGSDGHELAAIIPHYETAEHTAAAGGDRRDDGITTGAIGVLRIDGKGRGFAGGLGLAFSRGKLEAEIMVLKSDQLGGYIGLRYRLLDRLLRPYVAAGVPAFAFDHGELQSDGTTMTTNRLAVGARIAAGVELRLGNHVSVQGDIGYEHFFFLDNHYEADVLVPTLGVIGRL